MEIASVGSARDQKLMDRICKIKVGGGSPLCNDRELYNTGKKISEERGANWEVVLGIMYSESHVGSNYAGTCDKSWNNWGGVKAMRGDDNKVRRDQAIPNNGCWLYKFETMEDYFITKANIIGSGYKGCMKAKSNYSILKCISYKYVGDPNVSEESWIKNALSIIY